MAMFRPVVVLDAHDSMNASSINRDKVDALHARGVVMPCPASVEVAADVDPKRIAPGVVIHTGCRIAGAQLSIGSGSELGAEAPVTLEDCQLGRNVVLKGGYFSGATFLDGANMGSCAHVRPGTLLEEEANGAHAVGFKQTILLPFVTAGSLINFCDALMAGGKNRKNHSEIGSSYIHFNYTPHQDKATASLIGDVPHGVMMEEPPIFLGGQGGLVGPVRIAYGSVIPAGLICRQDILTPNTLYAPPPAPGPAVGTRAFRAGAYRAIQRIVNNNLIYIGNILALREWYRIARQPRMTGDFFSRACWEGALIQIDRVLKERINRLEELAHKMVDSLRYAREDSNLSLPPALCDQQEALIQRWPEMASKLRTGPSPETGAGSRDVFLSAWENLDPSLSPVEAVRALLPDVKTAGTAWLQAIVDAMSTLFGPI
jgi:bifunctional UDP-N-acetylglucosamine pyrophosphorylase/glucosamine-1-phosphate N-acetyltransferase